MLDDMPTEIIYKLIPYLYGEFAKFSLLSKRYNEIVQINKNIIVDIIDKNLFILDKEYISSLCLNSSQIYKFYSTLELSCHNLFNEEDKKNNDAEKFLCNTLIGLITHNKVDLIKYIINNVSVTAGFSFEDFKKIAVGLKITKNYKLMYWLCIEKGVGLDSREPYLEEFYRYAIIENDYELFILINVYYVTIKNKILFYANISKYLKLAIMSNAAKIALYLINLPYYIVECNNYDLRDINITTSIYIVKKMIDNSVHGFMHSLRDAQTFYGKMLDIFITQYSYACIYGNMEIICALQKAMEKLEINLKELSSILARN
jgi:hypothetical protein